MRRTCYPCFSFFVIPDSDDGIEDIEELYLYHDREGLRWHIKSDDWVQHESDEQIWIGSRSISMPDGDGLPRGQYRAVLVNKGGEKSERTFTFDAPEESIYPFPFLSISEGYFRVDSKYPQNSFIGYDGEGNYLVTVSLDVTEGLVSSLKMPNNVRSVALWADNPDYLTSALTDVVSIR